MLNNLICHNKTESDLFLYTRNFEVKKVLKLSSKLNTSLNDKIIINGFLMIIGRRNQLPIDIKG